MISMRVATYNIWNHSATFESRRTALHEELIKIQADVIALQEVPLESGNTAAPSFLEEAAHETGYKHVYFKAYPNDNEGLGLLSRTPLEAVEYAGNEKQWVENCAVRVMTEIAGQSVGITNVHLDWKSALVREKQIVAITDWIEQTSSQTEVEFLCGDFNALPNASSVYCYLMGQQSLAGIDTSWIDLADLFFRGEKGIEPPATLDFTNNPWLHNRDKLNRYREPYRFDWVLLKSLFPKPEPERLQAELFGVYTEKNTVPPSDHYGVLVEVWI